jgi:SulP family sulfate permease
VWTSSGSKYFDYGGAPEENQRPAALFLPDATVEEWALIGSYCERRRFRAGEVIFDAGEHDRSLIIVLDGSLDTVASRKSRQRRLSPAPAGSVVGEIGFLDGGPRSAAAIAASDGELLRMTFESFETLSAINPRLGQAMLLDLGRILAARLRTLTDVVMAR